MTGNGFHDKGIKEAEYDIFRQFLENACGIILGDNKQYLVGSRLSSILKERGNPSLKALVDDLTSDPRSGMKQEVIDAMTTNETLWFRDVHPFEYFINELFAERAKVSGGRLRIWSAACSSGQEPYSLSICADEAIKGRRLPASTNLQIIATDICTVILDKAKLGRYEALALNRGLTNERLKKNFIEIGGGEWEIKPEIKRRVEFRIWNLQDSFRQMGKFDIICCRNVLIYFSAEFKADILRRLHGCLVTGGYLFLGASESLNDLKDLYEMKQYPSGISFRAI